MKKVNFESGEMLLNDPKVAEVPSCTESPFEQAVTPFPVLEASWWEKRFKVSSDQLFKEVASLLSLLESEKENALVTAINKNKNGVEEMDIEEEKDHI